ncbi:MAG: class I adenylate-forming enzyme family protein, partial [Chloroflexota bacterium]
MTAGTSLAPSLAASARLAGADPSRASRLAVVDANTRWTWAELDGRADAVAAALTEHGVEPGDRVALLARPSAEVVAILHGIARVGAAAAPLGTGMTRREAGPVAAVLGARIVIAGPGFEGLGSLLADRVIGLPDVRGEGGRPIPAEKTPGDASAPAVAILTSGTTGRPKVAILSVAALTASTESWLAALPAATGWLLAVGLGHVAGMGVVWRSALAGVPLVVLERPDASAIVTALAVDPWPSHVSLVPTVLERVLDITRDAPPPATLRAVPVGGGSIPPALVTRALKAGWPVVPTYGLTEAGSGVTALPTSEAAVHPGSAGRALPGVQLRISAPDAGGIGDIEVRGDAIFDGYLGDPDATASAVTADGWLRTGDLGSLDVGGRLTVADRRTDRIVRGGENISPAEVEAVLLDHPAVADAAVVARRDSGLGQVPVAAIVVRQDATDPGDEALAEFVRARVARF